MEEENFYINIPMSPLYHLDCPYCNISDINVVVAFNHGITPSYAIKCNKCNTTTGYYDSIYKAAKAWEIKNFVGKEGR